MFFNDVAYELHYDAVDDLAKGVFQCNGSVGLGFRVVWLSGVSHDDRCGCFEGHW